MKKSEYEAITKDHCGQCGTEKYLVLVSREPVSYLCNRCSVHTISRQYLPHHKLADKDGHVSVSVFHRSVEGVSNAFAHKFLEKMRQVSERKAAGYVQPGRQERGRQAQSVPDVHGGG